MPGEGVALTGHASASLRHGPMRKSECKSSREAKKDLRPRRLGRGIDECGNGADWRKRESWAGAQDGRRKVSSVQVMPIERLKRKLPRLGRALQEAHGGRVAVPVSCALE